MRTLDSLHYRYFPLHPDGTYRALNGDQISIGDTLTFNQVQLPKVARTDAQALKSYIKATQDVAPMPTISACPNIPVDRKAWRIYSTAPITLSPEGSLSASIVISSHSIWGFHGALRFEFYSNDHSLLATFTSKDYGVNPFSSRAETYSISLPRELLAYTSRIETIPVNGKSKSYKEGLIYADSYHQWCKNKSSFFLEAALK